MEEEHRTGRVGVRQAGRCRKGVPAEGAVPAKAWKGDRGRRNEKARSVAGVQQVRAWREAGT